MSDTEGSNNFLSSELGLRIVSALILAALVLAATILGGSTFELLWAIVALAICYEFGSLIKGALPFQYRVSTLFFAILSIGAWISGNYQIAIIIFFIAAVLISVWEFLLLKTCWALTCLSYVLLPFFAMSHLRGTEDDGIMVILTLFACVWGADVFAYFFGRAIGGPKLAPRISPKKTWSGFLGGMLGSMVLVWGVTTLMGHSVNVYLAVLVLILAVLSQVGDLIESMLKRKFRVKDSSNLIPGHGGVLDRVDGLVVSAVILWLILLAMSGFSLIPDTLSIIFNNTFLTP